MKKLPQAQIEADSSQSGTERLLQKIRSLYLASEIVEPESSEWPAQLHLTQGLYEMGKLSEAILTDSPTAIQSWALKLSARALAIAVSAEREDEE